MAVASGGKKASFTNVDDKKTFYVQFNPSEFQLSEKASYKKADEQQRSKPALEYSSGDPTVVKMKLVFDTTDTGVDIDTAFIQELRSFLTAEIEIKDGEHIKHEPPKCTFTWNNFNFDCVVEQVSAKYLMFSPDGVPLRAEVDVSLKERDRFQYMTGGNSQGSMVTLSAFAYDGTASPAYRTHNNNAAITHVVRAGQNVPGIADEHGVPWRAVAAANGIWDPTELVPGTTLIIPGDPEMAEVLAAHQLAQSEGNPLPAPVGPFGAPSASVHELQDPEVFDEVLQGLGAEFNSAAAIGEYGDGELDSLDSGSADADFFAEAAESGERPDMATWESGFSEEAMAEYLGADMGPLDSALAIKDYDVDVAESGPAPEKGVFEGGPSDSAMSEYEGADIAALESAAASEGSPGASNENAQGGSALQDYEANVVESGPAPEAATNETVVGDGAAEESTGATHTNAEGGSALQEYEANVVESGPAPEAATNETVVGDGAAEESTGATHTNAEGGSAVQEHESALAESGPPPTAATAEVMESSAAAGESLGGGDGGTATDTPSEVAPEAQDRGESSAQAGVSDSNKDN
jgi:LysM repeat protein